MKTEFTAHVFMELGWNDDYSKQEWKPTVWKCRVSDDKARIYVGEQVITIEVPEDFDPRPSQIAALEQQKRQAEAAFANLVTDINRQISELQAIEYTPEAA